MFFLVLRRYCVITNQSQQKEGHDYHAQERVFTFNDDVFVKNFTSTCPNWLPGKTIVVKSQFLMMSS